MARPIKEGLDYFPFNVDFFTDIKVRRITKACGPTSQTILICLLCNIYQDKGYYIEWNKDLPFLIADSIGVSEGVVEEVIKKAIQVRFFDDKIFEACSVLTSEGIQKRYLSATERRKMINWNSRFLIDSIKNLVNVDINEDNENNNPINDNNSTQSKVKESIVENKEKDTKVSSKKEEKKQKAIAAKAATKKRKEDFYKTLVPYVEQYGKEMIRAFFNYWSELTKSETKMRFELNKTWELSLRLNTWNRNNKAINKDEQAKQKTDTSFTGLNIVG